MNCPASTNTAADFHNEDAGVRCFPINDTSDEGKLVATLIYYYDTQFFKHVIHFSLHVCKILISIQLYYITLSLLKIMQHTGHPKFDPNSYFRESLQYWGHEASKQQP